MPEQKQFSLINSHFTNLSGNGYQLDEVVIAERNIEQPKKEYGGLPLNPTKHIVVLHQHDRNELERQIDGTEEKSSLKKAI